MKKTEKTTILVSVLCITMILALTACGGGGASSASMEGRYVISAMMYGDEDFLKLMQDLAEMMETEFDLEDFMYLEFSENGTVTIGTEGDEEAGTYKLDGKTITITLGEESMSGTIDGDSFTIEQEEDDELTTMTFTKK